MDGLQLSEYVRYWPSGYKAGVTDKTFRETCNLYAWF